MNLPNKLTLLRVILVPVFMIFYLCNFGLGFWSYLIAAVIYIIAACTDFLDGHIARKYGLVTNLGKFLDPVADKVMVMASLLCLCYGNANSVYGILLTFATAIVILRELAVTSMRLVAASADGSVIAAAILGKIKTAIQMSFVSIAILEPFLVSVVGVAMFATALRGVLYALLAGMVIMTVWSGMDYLMKYWKYIKE
jgi:CDP-diacylglycerol--glycerol-3-phosphate 3-phosphatidyltransferase